MSALPPLATAQELRDWSGLDVPDPQAELLLASASGMVRAYCGWHIAPVLTRDQMILDGKGGTLLALRTLRLLTVHLVLTGRRTERVRLDRDSYDWSESGYLSRTRGPWPVGPRQVIVVVQHGWTRVPPEVRGIVLDLATRQADARQTPPGVARETTGPFTVQYTDASGLGSTALTEPEENVLDRYAIPEAP